MNKRVSLDNCNAPDSRFSVLFCGTRWVVGAFRRGMDSGRREIFGRSEERIWWRRALDVEAVVEADGETGMGNERLRDIEPRDKPVG